MKSNILKIIWDFKTLNELKDILNYLEKKSKQAPSLVKHAIIEKLELASKTPFLFEKDRLIIPESNEIRAFIVFSYRVTYQVKLDQNEIRVLRIRHASREPLGF